MEYEIYLVAPRRGLKQAEVRGRVVKSLPAYVLVQARKAALEQTGAGVVAGEEGSVLGRFA